MVVTGNGRRRFCGLARCARRNNVANPIPPDRRFLISSGFAWVLKLTVAVVASEGVILDEGPYLHPQAPHQHAPQLRLRGFALLQALQRLHQVHPVDRRGGGKPRGVQPRLQRRGSSNSIMSRIAVVAEAQAVRRQCAGAEAA